MQISVPDMSCNHCKASVEGAIRGVDPAAVIGVDMIARKVEVTTTAPAPALIAALDAVGFPATVA